MLQGVETIQVGSVGVQGRYFSDRMMMVAGGAGAVAGAGTQPLYTVSASVNLTRLLAVMVELGQQQDGTVCLDTVHQWLR